MSAATPPVPAPLAVRAGADLKAARERLGLALRDVALDLRIRQSHLEALEHGRISLLPGNAYALAFVRSYAAALGLDAAEIVRRFRIQAAEFDRPTKLVFPAPMPQRDLPAGARLLLGLVLAIAVYTGWYNLSGNALLPAETVMAIPERLAPLAEQAMVATAEQAMAPTAGQAIAPTAGQAIAPTAGPAMALAAGSAGYGPPMASMTAEASSGGAPQTGLGGPAAARMLANPDAPIIAISPASAAAAQVSAITDPLAAGPADGPAAPGDLPVPAAVTIAAPAPESPNPTPPTPALPAPDIGRVVLRASADAWIVVKDRAGTTLLSRTLKAGETWPVPPRPDLLLTTGNAGGTDILVDAAPTAGLGGTGIVRRDLPLNPDLIKDGKLAPAAMPRLASTRPRQ